MAIAELAGSYLAALNQPPVEFKPHPEGFVPKDIALIDVLLKEHSSVGIHLDNGLALYVSHDNSRGTRYRLLIRSPHLKTGALMGGGTGPISTEYDPPARDLGLRIHKDLRRRTFLNLVPQQINDLSRDELRDCLNSAYAHELVKKSEPERPLFYGAGWPSLVPGDYGANQLADIADQFRNLRARWRQWRHPSLRNEPR